MDGEDKRSDDVDGWTDPPGDPDAAGAAAEFVDVAEGQTPAPGETPPPEPDEPRSA